MSDAQTRGGFTGGTSPCCGTATDAAAQGSCCGSAAKAHAVLIERRSPYTH